MKPAPQTAFPLDSTPSDDTGKVEGAEMDMGAWNPICELPTEGCFLVWLEKPMLDSQVQVMNKRVNYATIGSQFAFDAPKPFYWMPLPEPPTL